MHVFMAAVAGIFAGGVHVLSGPDHLAAIAPLASDGRRRTWTAGALWGLGHSSGVLIVGLLALLFKDWLPLDALSSWSERLVGIVLVAIGLWGLHRALRTRVHSHAHAHGPFTHAHTHAHVHDPHPVGADAAFRIESGSRSNAAVGINAAVHSGAAPVAIATADATAAADAKAAGRAQGIQNAPGALAATPHTHTHAAFAVGILHGLAGSSHFLAVLPALALPGLDDSLAYLTGYGVGTVTAMSGFAIAIGFVAARAHRTGPGAARWLLSGCSVAAMLVGVAWLSL